MKPRLAIAAAAVLAALASALMFVLPAQAATGFTVSGGRLIDANGQDFIMRGVNHAHTWYPSQTGSFAAIKALGANTVRVVLSTGDQWTRNDAADVANVIARCKANRLICVLEAHDTTGYGEASGAVTLDRAADYWISVQSALAGQEAYVIVNIGNEPYGNLNGFLWTGGTSAAIKKLRSAGINHTIMVDAPNWGQDWSFTMRDNAASVFAADPNRNTLFSVHMYGVFDTAAEINAYLNRFVNAGLPILVGEFGHNHSDGNPDEDTILATTQSLRLGYLGWSWSGNGGGVEYLDMATNFDPNALTSWGERIFNGANGIRQTAKEASVFGGSPTPTPTATPTPSPSPTGGPSACTATYTVVGQWPNGFQGDVKVTAGSARISRWTVTLTFANGQTVSSSWNAAVTASGARVAAANMPYNGSLAAGASTNFGFTGTWRGSNHTPALSCAAN